jgi:hypothetical protein
MRVVMICAGAAAFVPDWAIGFPIPGAVSGVGAIVGAAVLTLEYFAARRVATARSPAE